MTDDFQVGKRVPIDGHIYTIKKMIRGGMGLVLLSTSINESGSFLYRNELATKVFFPDQNVQQIRAELQLWQQLSHPHIATLLAVGHVNDWLCGSMPWFPNGAITADGMRALGGLTAIQTMLTQMSQALQYALEKKVLHLDIKPANILSRDNRYYLADWGIAKFSAHKAVNNDPTSGGTLPYMAPERFIKEPTSVVSDIYSLGMTAMQMLTGVLPFSENSTDEMIESIVMGRITDRLEVLTQDIPKQWRFLILKCCAYKSEARPQSYKQLSQLIEQLEV